MTPSEKRLLRLVCQLIPALENPARGIVFDDFDLRYRASEQLRELKSAAWFYRDKTSFETKYAEDGGTTPGNEPAWVSDGGRGATVLSRAVSFDLDGEDGREDDPKRRGRLTSTWDMKWRAAKKRVRRNIPHALTTLKLVYKNHNNQRESICSLVMSGLSTRGNGIVRGRSTSATSTTSSTSSKPGRKRS